MISNKRHITKTEFLAYCKYVKFENLNEFQSKFNDYVENKINIELTNEDLMNYNKQINLDEKALFKNRDDNKYYVEKQEHSILEELNCFDGDNNNINLFYNIINDIPHCFGKNKSMINTIQLFRKVNKLYPFRLHTAKGNTWTAFNNNKSFLTHLKEIPTCYSHYYEILNGSCKLYCDVDFKPTQRETTKTEQFKFLKDMIKNIKIQSIKYFDVKIKDDEIKILGYENEKGFNYHFIIDNGLYFNNPMEQKNFWKEFQKLDIQFKVVDDKVYKNNQQFKTVYSSKLNYEKHTEQKKVNDDSKKTIMKTDPKLYRTLKPILISENDFEINEDLPIEELEKYFINNHNSNLKYYNTSKLISNEEKIGLSNRVKQTFKKSNENFQDIKFNNFLCKIHRKYNDQKIGLFEFIFRYFQLFKEYNIYEIHKHKCGIPQYMTLERKKGFKCRTCNKKHNKQKFVNVYINDVGKIYLKCFNNDKFEYLGVYPFCESDWHYINKMMEIEPIDDKGTLALTKKSKEILKNWIKEVYVLIRSDRIYLEKKHYIEPLSGEIITKWKELKDFPWVFSNPISYGISTTRYIFNELYNDGELTTRSELIFLPYYGIKDPLKNSKHYFNTFCPFWFNYYPSNNNIKFENTTIYTLLFELICNGNKTSFNYVIKWLKDMLLNPSSGKKPTTINFKSTQGIGKDSMKDALIKLLGSLYSMSLNKVSQLTQKHSAHLSNIIFLVLNEINSTQTKRDADQLKSLQTELKRFVEPKFKMGRETYNFMRIMTFSNHDPIILEGTDRRNTIIQCADVPKDKDFYNKYHKEIKNKDYIKTFIDYILNFENEEEEINVFKPLENEARVIAKEMNKDIKIIIIEEIYKQLILKFGLHKEPNKKFNIHKLHIAKIMDEYYLEQNINPIHRKKLKDILGKLENMGFDKKQQIKDKFDPNNKKKGRGIAVSIDLIESIHKKHFSKEKKQQIEFRKLKKLFINEYEEEYIGIDEEYIRPNNNKQNTNSNTLNIDNTNKKTKIIIKNTTEAINYIEDNYNINSFKLYKIKGSWDNREQDNVYSLLDNTLKIDGKIIDLDENITEFFKLTTKSLDKKNNNCFPLFQTINNNLKNKLIKTNLT